MATRPARTDRHAPASPDFDPEAYRFIDVFDLHREYGDHRYLSQEVRSLERQGIYRAGHTDGSHCGHCGARIRYAALMVRDDEWIFVGQDCLSNRFLDMSRDQFQAIQKRAAESRAAHKLRLAFEAYCDVEQTVAYMSYAQDMYVPGGDWALGVLSDMKDKAYRYGGLSDKQLAFADKLWAELDSKAQRAVAQASLPVVPAVVAGPVPVGKVRITGTVVSLKWQDGPYGNTLKMLVLLDNGAKVWGTVPAAIHDVARGARVEFLATVTAKAGEPSFGFYSRPQQAGILVSA